MNCLGHCPPEISPALSGFQDVHFANSGAEANEAAVKLARKWGRLHKAGAYKVITTHNAFHGRTLAMMAASGKPGWEQLFAPQPQGFVKVPFGCAESLCAAVDDKTVALMVEPIQGEAGVIMPPTGYLQALRRIADRHNLLLIFDEIQTGIGRTGALFGFQRTGVSADIMTLGKGLGGGVPLSAVLDVVAQPAFLRHVRYREVQLSAGLRALAQRHDLPEVRGQGLLYALRLSQPRAEIIRDLAFETGLLINAARPDVLRFMPSLRVSEAEVAQFLDLLDDCLAAGLLA